jgi:twitching motility protein PilT
MSELLTDDEIQSLMNPDVAEEVPAEKPSIQDFLQAVLTSKNGISDLNLSVGRPPHLSVDGELESTPLWEEPLRPADTAAFAKYLMGRRPDLEAKIRETGSCDCSHTLPSGVRTRVNVFKVRSAFAVVMRKLPGRIPTFEDLHLPKVLAEIPALQNGLVLVTGATGSGKSTTMASILDRINSTRALHIVALEDPIEFVHPHKQSTVNQRELGRDFSEFGQGLRSALRQGPQVIFVGEIRDRETLETTLKAAETGHLVLSTMHTIDAGQTINRITGMFPAEEFPVIAYRLSQVLRFVVAQRLLPRVGGGRIAVREIMGNDLRVQELIRSGENGKRTYHETISASKSKGWTTFDHHIVSLLAKGLITDEVATAYASNAAVLNRERDRLHSKQGLDTSGLGDLEMASRKLEKQRPEFMSMKEIAPKRGPKSPRRKKG